MIGIGSILQKVRSLICVQIFGNPVLSLWSTFAITGRVLQEEVDLILYYGCETLIHRFNHIDIRRYQLSFLPRVYRFNILLAITLFHRSNSVAGTFDIAEYVFQFFRSSEMSVEGSSLYEADRALVL